MGSILAMGVGHKTVQLGIILVGMKPMTTRPLRIYADTSVYGGVFDDEFARPSLRFFECVREGRFGLVHYQKMPMYNAVNALLRHGPIEIHSPSEVIEDEDQDI